MESRKKSEVMVLTEEVTAMGNGDEHARAIIKRSLRQLRKIEEEEEAASSAGPTAAIGRWDMERGGRSHFPLRAGSAEIADR